MGTFFNRGTSLAEDELGSGETTSQQDPKDSCEASQDLHLVNASPEDVSSEPLCSDAIISAPDKPSGLRQKIARLERELTKCKKQLQFYRKELATLSLDDPSRPEVEEFIQEAEDDIEEFKERLHRAQQKQVRRDENRAREMREQRSNRII